jgi:2-keto-4-pentenoate hydratase/2-oxohepta-3-ene-1,7-dioic acid hydratase in catechol pathway
VVRLATVLDDDGGCRVAVVRGDHVLELETSMGMVDIASASDALTGIRDQVAARPAGAWRPLADVTLGPAVPNPGAIYTVGLNYDGPGAAPRPQVPLIYGKAAASVGAPGSLLAWDRSLTANVDPECELGIVIGTTASGVPPASALQHVFGYTIINDVSSRDPWLDGDQWLLGKSMPGFSPVGPWIVTPDDLDTSNLRLGCRLNGEPLQDGSTAQLRFGIGDIISWISRHLVLRPGDLVATGTPPRLATLPGPNRHLEAGDEVTCWIEGIGELTTRIA